MSCSSRSASGTTPELNPSADYGDEPLLRQAPFSLPPSPFNVNTSALPHLLGAYAGRLFFTSSVLRQPALAPTPSRSFLTSITYGPPLLGLSARSASPSPFSHAFALAQVRYVSSRDRRKKRKPLTPVVSKVKKTKMKFYSSFKSRFRPMNDGNIRRWKEGKRHNAHLKSKKSKRRLRQPAVVHLAYAKVMKKLSFCS